MTKGKPKSSLKRGLKALIPDSDRSTVPGKEIIDIDISLIDRNPMQPRQEFNPAALEDLKESILDVGVLSPIIVQKTGERYQLIAGERRLQASKLAGKETIPAMIKNVNSEELLKLALIENVQRENLNDIELAVAYKKLRDEFYLTQNEIAKKVGKSRSVIANTLRLLELSQNIQEAVRSGEITSGHARALISLDEDKREKVLEIIRKKSLSVREVEEMARIGRVTTVAPVEENGKSTSETKVTVSLDPDTINLLKSIEEKLRTKVELLPSKKDNSGGKVVIHYYGDDDFMHILTALAELTSSSQPVTEEQAD